MLIEVVAKAAAEVLCDTLIVGIAEGSLPAEGAASQIDRALNGNISQILKDQAAAGRYGEITVIYTFGAIAAKQVMLIGLGDVRQLTVDKVRALAGMTARALRKQSSKSAAILFQQEEAVAALGNYGIQAIAEGLQLGIYDFTYYKSTKKPSLLEQIYLVVNDAGDAASAQRIVDTSLIIAENVNFARDLVNHPSIFITPSRMADYANEIAADSGMKVRILRPQEICQEGMEAFWAVAKGSDEPPALIILTYRGAKENTECLGLIGKGITFDSGGISLKPSEGMGEMKDDMGGAAAVLGTMRAVGRLKPPINIVAVIPCAENMPSGKALKPGDVIGSLAGKSIEIISTDAEGRLILADALFYATKLGATKLIDLATLTGACVVALGKTTSGVIANNQEWVETVLKAADASGERMWQLPAFDEYKEQIKSDIADIKNSGGRPAGAITAGLFLAEFVDQTPWVHIDIGGTVTCSKESGYNPKGATGVGVRTLLHLIDNL